MQVDPLTYRKMLVIICMIPALVLVMSGITYITTTNMNYNTLVNISDGSEEKMVKIEVDIAKHRLNATVLIIVGFLTSFILIGRYKNELKELKQMARHKEPEPDKEPDKDPK